MLAAMGGDAAPVVVEVCECVVCEEFELVDCFPVVGCAFGYCRIQRECGSVMTFVYVFENCV